MSKDEKSMGVGVERVELNATLGRMGGEQKEKA